MYTDQLLWDTVDLVKRVERVVRWHRSIKAIETYNQVQFLASLSSFCMAGMCPHPICPMSMSRLQAWAPILPSPSLPDLNGSLHGSRENGVMIAVDWGICVVIKECDPDV